MRVVPVITVPDLGKKERFGVEATLSLEMEKEVGWHWRLRLRYDAGLPLA